MCTTLNALTVRFHEPTVLSPCARIQYTCRSECGVTVLHEYAGQNYGNYTFQISMVISLNPSLFSQGCRVNYNMHHLILTVCPFKIKKTRI